MEKDYYKKHRDICFELAKKNTKDFYSDKKMLFGDVVSDIVVSAIVIALSPEGKGETMLVNIIIIIIAVLGGLITIGISRFLFNLYRAPFEIMEEQKKELEKYKWDSVPIKICDYSMIDGKNGWAIKINNNKSIPIGNFSISIFKIKSRGKTVFSGKNFLSWFGYIYKDEGYSEEKIVFPHEVNINAKKGESRVYLQTLLNGKEYIFPITSKVGNGNHSFYNVTSPSIPQIIPKNITLKVVLCGKMDDGSEYYSPNEKTIEIYFDENSKPKILN